MVDMSKAYHPGFMDKDSRHFTAFTSPCGLYKWLRMPFGLLNAPPAFQRFMNECLAGIRDSICIPYLDDILCYRKTLNEHLRNSRKMLQRLKNVRVKRKAEKCVFFQKEIKYLGNIISENGYRDSTINTEALEKLQEHPKTIGDLRKLLGFLGNFAQSICYFFRKVKSLQDILCVPPENTPSNSKQRSKKGKRTTFV